MNLSKKHLHKESPSFLELMSSKLESSKEFHSQTNQIQNDDDDDDYLLDLVDYDFTSEEVEEALQQDNEYRLSANEDVVSIKYREFPIEDGYVRVPTTFPGLNISVMEPPDLKLWTAEAAFKEQVKFMKNCHRSCINLLCGI